MKRYLILLILVLTTAGALAFKLQWANAPANEGITNWTIYEKTSGSYGSPIGTVTPAPSPAPSPTFQIPNPIPAGPHTYGVSASNIRGEGPKSDVTLPDVPSAPGPVTVGP